LREMAKEGTQILNKKLHVFDPGDAYDVQIQSASGVLFPGNGMFIGANKDAGALLTYLVNKPAKEKKEEKASTEKEKDKKNPSKAAAKPDESKVAPIKKDSVGVKADTVKGKKEILFDSLKVEIFDKTGEKIRTIKQKAPDENGVHKFVWNLAGKGVQYPSREKSKSTTEPSGYTVLPGTYKVRFTFGDAKDSTSLTVKPDPRYNTPMSVIEERYKLLQDLQKLTATCAEATRRLVESREIADGY
jgi:hypothetical protein